MQRRWFVNRTNPEFLDYLSRSAGVSAVFAQVLINRGIRTAAAVGDFLSPSLSSVSDPFGLLGMREAVERIRHARSSGERILIHGDYDADGITATAILVAALRKAGFDVHYFIPNRHAHGYGFNRPGLDHAKTIGAKLVITVDCGIGAFETVRDARAAGIDVIITDHHEPVVNNEQRPMSSGNDSASHVSRLTSHDVMLPDACAVIDPKIPGNPPELSTLSGAGLAFKCAQALALTGDVPLDRDDVFALADIAALGTVADVVPLIGENRVIVREGLQLINTDPRPGIAALRDVAKMNGRPLRSETISYIFAPRLNAAGRMSDATDAVRLLLTGDRTEADGIADWIQDQNAERKRQEDIVAAEVIPQMEQERDAPVIVLAGEGWHEGVIGIVASRVAENCNRPAIVLSLSDGVARGSGRSIPAFDLHGALTECEDLLIGYGGHRQAAGLRLRAEHVADFRQRIQAIARKRLADEDFIPVIEIDADVELTGITPALLQELQRMEPLGYGNAEVVLGAKGLEVVSPRIVGDNHIKMRLKQRHHSIDTIGFDMGEEMETLQSHAAVDAAFTPSVNEWNGQRLLQLKLKAVRPSAGS